MILEDTNFLGNKQKAKAKDPLIYIEKSDLEAYGVVFKGNTGSI